MHDYKYKCEYIHTISYISHTRRRLLRSRRIDPVFPSTEDITVSTARKGIPQAALNRMEIIRENVSGTVSVSSMQTHLTNDCPLGCAQYDRLFVENEKL